MRILIYSGLAATVAGLVMSVSGAAQKFQEPTKEELQMTADPKVPGAAAVFLYREEKTDNGNHTVSRYARIKVLTEAGREWATVEVPYRAVLNSMPTIEGRTIHSDGTIVPLVGKASDLLVFKTDSSQLRTAAFNLPSVEVGSILEYSWTLPMTGVTFKDEGESSGSFYAGALAGEIPTWDVQARIYVHKAHFFFNPYTNLAGGGFTESRAGTGFVFTQRLPSGSKVIESQSGDFTLDIQDVPAFHAESNEPPLDSLEYKVLFYWTPFQTSALYWNNEQKLWSKRLDQFAGHNDAIRTAASQITAGADTPAAKAQKLYDAVQGLENTDFARVKDASERKALHMKAEVKSASEVWNEKSGSGNDLAALYLALARAAGLDARGIQVADRSRRIFDSNYLTLDQLDALVVALKVDGKDVYLDPGEKLCPFGQLAWQHSLAGGLDQASAGPAVTPPNSTKDAITAHAAELTLDAQGNASGTVKILMNGPEALQWRQAGLRETADEVSKRLHERLIETLPTGFNAEILGIQGLNTPQGYLSVTAKVDGSLGTVTGKRILLPAFFFSTNAHNEFVGEEKRESPVDMHYAEQVIDDAIYHLPAGFTVESAPQPAQLSWSDHAALVVKTAPGSGTIDIKHIFARAFVLLDPKEYPALRDYYQKMAANDQQQLVLASGGAAAGN